MAIVVGCRRRGRSLWWIDRGTNTASLNMIMKLRWGRMKERKRMWRI